MSVDFRTRVDGAEPSLSPDEILDALLPEAFARAGATLAGASRVLAPPPLVVEVKGQRWCLAVADGGPTVSPGGSDYERALHLRVDAGQLADLYNDQVTPMGWFLSGRLDLDGRLERLLDWWVSHQRRRRRQGALCQRATGLLGLRRFRARPPASLLDGR